MTRYGGMGRTRPKKLTSKASIPIVREDQVEAIDEDAQAILQQVETGVEKAEESEFHLQAAISAVALGNVSEANIPTPETVLSSIRYENLYPSSFSQPATYIRFSSTVEDCCGCLYNLVEEDEVFLKIMNQKRDAPTQCSEDLFEEGMRFFEETAQSKQPFAAVDNPPVLSFSEIEENFDAAVDEGIRRFANDIYEHWKSRRVTNGNRPLQPSLKFETGQETDDGDPYVCFRRREVRQIRKTRGRDAQSAEKLRRLRKELEDARQLVAFVRQRELARKEILSIERQIFLQRAEVKEAKRKLGIKDDDEDLINQKPKKKQVDPSAIQRPSAPPLRIPSRPGSQIADDLQLLEDVQAEKENEIIRDIKQNVAKHINWNDGYLDMTRLPLTPSPKKSFEVAFRPAVETGPLSICDKFAAQSVDVDHYTSRIPSFRRRVGRGGRIMIDRRNIAHRCNFDVDPIKLDRFKYDDEDEDEDLVFDCDVYDTQIMQHRAIMTAKARDQALAAAQLQAHAQAQAQAQRRLHSEQNTATAALNSLSSVGPHPGSGATGPKANT